jgi:hypothetical protein
MYPRRRICLIRRNLPILLVLPELRSLVSLLELLSELVRWQPTMLLRRRRSPSRNLCMPLPPSPPLLLRTSQLRVAIQQ